jgi:hypothetical protein
MITSWGILCPLKKLSNPYPSKDALQTICSDTEVINAIVDEDDDDDDDPKQSSVEETCKVILPRELPSREIDTKDAESSDNEHVKHQRLLTIFGCIPKHCQKKPVVKGSGYTGAVLSDMPTFTALVEYLLCFHAWCHYSSNLPIELQEDFELIAFSSAMVVQYFDTIIYRGDDSVDTDTCKIHSQLHHSYTIARFGDPMQYNTEVGERGLREWAKRLARTALKHGRDKFTESTSDRVKERLLFNTAADQARWTAPVPPETEVKSRRKMPHFRFERNKQPNLRSLG